MKHFSVLVLLCAAWQLNFAQIPTRKVINDMVATISKQRGYSFVMNSTERLVGKTTNRLNMMQTKVNVNPLKIYAKVLAETNKGTELLYAKGERGDKIRVNPGKFLPTLNLPGTSSMLTKEQHHTLLTSGFSIVNRLMGDAIKRSDAQGKFEDFNQVSAAAFANMPFDFPPPQLPATEVDAIRSYLQDLLTEWNQLPAGETMLLNFEL